MNFDFSYLDIAFKNGSVITVNAQDEIAQAVGVKGNKIVFVGSNEDIDQLIDEKTQVIDLKGRTLMPGLNDSHYHPILNGMIGTELDSAMVDTGFAQPTPANTMQSVPSRSKWRKGFSDSLPCCLAVGSPSSHAASAWPASWKGMTVRAASTRARV